MGFLFNPHKIHKAGCTVLIYYCIFFPLMLNLICLCAYVSSRSKYTSVVCTVFLFFAQNKTRSLLQIINMFIHLAKIDFFYHSHNSQIFRKDKTGINSPDGLLLLIVCESISFILNLEFGRRDRSAH